MIAGIPPSALRRRATGIASIRPEPTFIRVLPAVALKLESILQRLYAKNSDELLPERSGMLAAPQSQRGNWNGKLLPHPKRVPNPSLKKSNASGRVTHTGAAVLVAAAFAYSFFFVAAGHHQMKHPRRLPF